METYRQEKTHQEVELKLQVLDHNRAAALWQLPIVREGLSEDPVEQDLSSRYFDTKDYRLLKHGFALRMREKNGGYTLTIKGNGDVAGGLHQREEWNYSAAGSMPDLDVITDLSLKRTLASLLESETLDVLLETTFRRTRGEWRDNKGSLVEIALDNGIIKRGDKTAIIDEVELELLEGRRKTLFSLGKAIAREIPVELGNESKFLRGVEMLNLPMLNSVVQWEKQPGNVFELGDEILGDLIPDLFEEVLRRVMERWTDLRHQELDVESVHRIRVECRQFRSLLRFFKPALSSASFRSLNTTLRKLSKEFGLLRQLDVMNQHYQQSPVLARTQHTASLILEQREREKNRVKTLVREGVYTPLLLEAWKQVTSCKVKPKAKDIPITDYAPRRLDIWRKKRGKWTTDVGVGNIEQLHRLRIRAKDIRYVVQWLAPALPDSYRKEGRKMKTQQNLLGKLHDAHQERVLLADWVQRGGLSAEVVYETGLYEGWLYRQEEALWNQAMSLLSQSKEGGEDSGPTEPNKKN